MHKVTLPLAAASLAAGTVLAASPAQAAVFNDVTLSGSMVIYDDDSGFWGTSYTKNTVNFGRTVTLGQYQQAHALDVNGCAANEVRIELDAHVAVHPDGSVSVTGQADMFEGTNCSSDDHDGQKTFSFLVPRNSSRGYILRVVNNDEGGDYADVRFSVNNRQQVG